MIFSYKMDKDIEIYLDPDEDEVFFGCISEKEKNLCAKLDVNSERNNKDEMVESLELNVDEKNKKNILMSDPSGEVHKEIIISDPLSSISNNQDENSVEMEHNYSTPLKPKIDKSILTTPKSIVKADKDGGFLKVLSEIALVKAEAEGEKQIVKRDDEDKENKKVHQIPEIRVTEATPERTVLSPPSNINKQAHQFKIVYKPPKENKVDQKSHSDCEDGTKNDIDQVFNNKRKSFDLIDLNDVDNSNDMKLKESVQKNNKESEDDLDCIFIKLNDTEKSINESPRDVKIAISDVKSPSKVETPAPKLPSGLRFSKEARKIVEVLKKSAFDDTLNFTVAEIDLENEENSFVSPESSDFYETELLIKEVEKHEPKHQKFLCKTVEKECHKVTPLVSQRKVEPVKHFSERKIYHQFDSRDGNKKCVKQLPLEEKKSTFIEKGKDLVPSSKIPLFGVKSAKTPLSGHISKTVGAKTASVKTPTSKLTPKNPKFSHIESPINAYIHNKEFALMINVKPDQKKNILTGIPKLQTGGSGKKVNPTKSQARSVPVPEKSTKHCSTNIKLPFVEYKSASTYKIEKVPESRLPRLAPSVQKLIGTQHPRVLKHEGRFYLTTPTKASSTENTIIADPNEVSVLVSQSAQKSNTIK